MPIDPFARLNEGLAGMQNTMLTLANLRRQDKQDAQAAALQGLQTQAAQQSVDEGKLKLSALNAGRSALIDQYGTQGQTDPYAQAVSFQQQESADKTKLEAKQKGFETYLNTIKALDGMGNLDATTKTEIGKHFLAQNPEYAEVAKNLKYVDSKGVKAARQFAEGELKDPATGQPLPAGFYETEGVWTGDAAQPVKLVSYKLTTPPKAEAADPEALLDKRLAAQTANTDKQIAAADRRAAAQIASSERKAARGGDDKTDAIVAREAVKDLPKLRREARTAEASKPRLQQMVKLIDSGAGGIKGNALAAIAGVFDTPATSEAELFKKLAAAGAGSLRTTVIGPGAVSNYEQSLLQAISGGGNGARTATRQLLKYYEQEADRTISNYNDAVDSAVTVAPKAAKGFGKLGGGSGRPLPKF